MARIKKTGLNYFPLDTNFFGDKKIVNLNQKFGSSGPMVLLNLYCEIYHNRGYYLVFDYDMLDYLCYQNNLNVDQLFEILNHLHSRSILTIRSLKLMENSEFTEESLPLLITAGSVQRQYQASIKTMKSTQKVDPNIWLLPESETEDCIEFSQNPVYPNLPPINPDLEIYCSWLQAASEDNPDSSELFQNIPGNSRNNQGNSKNPLYIKEKKRKEKKRNNIYSDSLSKKDESDKKAKKKETAKKKTKLDEKRKNNNNIVVSDINQKAVFGEFENVWLKGSEIDKLKIEYPEYWEKFIDTLSSYKASNGKGYKSDYAAMRQWVIKKVIGENQINSKTDKKQVKNNADDLLMRIARGEVNLKT